MSTLLEAFICAESGETLEQLIPEKYARQKQRKTLFDYPLTPKKKKSAPTVSSQLHLDIGFDTEYVYNSCTNQNEILSYQSYTVLPNGVGIPNIIYTQGQRKEDRLSLEKFLESTITHLMDQHYIDEWPGSITLYAHFLRADVASFSDFWREYKTCMKGIRSTVSSFKGRFGIDFADLENQHTNSDRFYFPNAKNEFRCTNISFTDTLLLTPGSMGLAECGSLVDLPKLSIPAPYSIADMRTYLKEDPVGYASYAIRDAEIAVRYALKVKSFCSTHLDLSHTPTTIGAMGVTYFRNTVKAMGMSLDKCMGTQQVVTTEWNRTSGAFRTKSKTCSLPSRELFESFAINAYHGGRNECFMMGVTPKSTWYDYDLAGAYTTGLLDILQPDYTSVRLSHEPTDFVGHVMGFALVKFTFPDSVRFPCLPVRTEQYGLFFPLSGVSWATAAEIELAVALGAELEIQHGLIVPWKKEEQDIPLDAVESESIFLPFVRKVREMRGNAVKGSLEEKFWKEIGNSLYGKLAQGLRAKTTFDTARGLNSPLPPSPVTQPFFAAHVTGFVRAVIGELMNRLPADNHVVSVTTDGFLTDTPMDRIDLTGPLSQRFQALCERIDPASSMLVCKHQAAQLIAIKTRGQLTVVDVTGQPIVHARAGVKPPADIPRESYNDYMVSLYLNRAPGQTLPQESLISTQQMWLRESDLINLKKDIRLNLEFDFKRCLYQPTMINNHLFMMSRPWNNMDDALKQRQLFDDWRSEHVLKTLVDWDDWSDYVYCRTQFTSHGLKVGTKRSDDMVKMLFLRAFTKCEGGITQQERAQFTYSALANWLTENGYETSESDVKNAGRSPYKEISTQHTTLRIHNLLNLLHSKFPSFLA
ncbi:DNA polymerase [Plesiomonas shigelloides]|uniref:hypothetical protein n=1 Tax=Plesiomonas shigelloides TaxID=703 RepID=UPI00351CE157